MPSINSIHLHSFHRFLDHLSLSSHLGTNLRVYHLSTPPVPTTPIFAAPPGQPDEPTTCESHFLTISQPHVIESTAVDPPIPTNQHYPAKTAGHVLLLGVEVLIFSTALTTTIFVSKADSTGFLTRPADVKQRSSTSTATSSSSIIQTVVSTFLDWLVAVQLSSTASVLPDVIDSFLAAHPTHLLDQNAHTKPAIDQTKGHKPSKRLVLSLFARSQSQYLFPGSVENSTKHVLDDRQLIKWWCRGLDGLVQKDSYHPSLEPSHVLASSPPSGLLPPIKVVTNAFVVVPGCDRTDTIRSFFPPSARHLPPDTVAKWHTSYPVRLLAPQCQLPLDAPPPIRCLIPRLPDDPKARYCQDLDRAGVNDKGQWKDIRSLPQFWETMEYRQECAAGRLVGFVWVVIDPVPIIVISPVSEPDQNVIATTSQKDTALTRATIHMGIDTNETHTEPQPQPQAQTQDHQTAASVPSPTTGSVTVTSEQYITLSDLLINDTDFAGADLAIKSTREWISKVEELSNTSHFGIDIEGRKAANSMKDEVLSVGIQGTVMVGGKHPREDGPAPINVLTGIRRKKQKVGVDESAGSKDTVGPMDLGVHGSEAENATITPQPNGRIDNQADQSSTIPNTNGVTTLSSGLVRKKPKAASTPESAAP